jgi:hypothetical protein
MVPVHISKYILIINLESHWKTCTHFKIYFNYKLKKSFEENDGPA